jgi:hypothetical protein
VELPGRTARADCSWTWLGYFLIRSHELVADSRDRKNKLGASGMFFQLLAQAGHVRIDCSSERTGLIAPQRPQEFRSRDSTSGAFYQVAKKLEFASGKINLLPISSNLCSPDVYADRTELVNTLPSTDWYAS